MSGTWVEVSVLPPCDICGQPARYDGKTRQGPWGYFCRSDFDRLGVRLGVGWGQRLILPDEPTPDDLLREQDAIRAERWSAGD